MHNWRRAGGDLRAVGPVFHGGGPQEKERLRLFRLIEDAVR